VIKVEVDSQFHGPTVTEISPVLDGISDNPVKVRWGGTKEEARLLETLEGRDFTVCVASLAEMGSVAGMLGCPLEVGDEIEKAGMAALASRRSYNWKRFAGDVGMSAARSIVVKMAADAVRSGNRPWLATVAADLIFGKAGAMEADSLLRLQAAERR
jgi:hypothetical protein